MSRVHKKFFFASHAREKNRGKKKRKKIKGPYKRTLIAAHDAYYRGAGVDEEAGVDKNDLIYPSTTLIYPGASGVGEGAGVDKRKMPW